MNKTIDAAIVVISLIAAAFALGMWVGAQNNLATRCIPQPGEKLASVEQHHDHLVCVYAQFPMTNKKARKAT